MWPTQNVHGCDMLFSSPGTSRGLLGRLLASSVTKSSCAAYPVLSVSGSLYSVCGQLAVGVCPVMDRSSPD